MAGRRPKLAPLSRVELLEAQRGWLVAAIGEASPRELPALSRELREVCRELDGLCPPVKKSRVDDLADRRKARRAGAAGVRGAVGDR